MTNAAITNTRMTPARMACAALALGLAAAAPAGELTAGAPLHDRVVATYSFQPHNLDPRASKAKSKELEAFWADVKSLGPLGLEKLRQELQRPDQPVFFSYDGAKLLLSLSNAPEDRALALEAINRADLRDVQKEDYFFTVHALAVDGLDTATAAMKILDEENYQVLLPRNNVLTLGQDFCLLYLLMPTDEQFYLDKLERRLFQEKNPIALKSILLVLGYTVTPEGDIAIRRFAEDRAQPESARAYARRIMDATRSMAQASPKGISSIESLKAERRRLLARISDEALIELASLQAKLRAKAGWKE